MQVVSTLHNFTNDIFVVTANDTYTCLAATSKEAYDLCTAQTAGLIFEAVITISSFYFLSRISACGFVIGLVFTDKVRETVKKVNSIAEGLWDQPYYMHFICTPAYLLFGAACIITLPVAFPISTVFYSSKLAMRIVDAFTVKEPKEYHPSSSSSSISSRRPSLSSGALPLKR